MDRFSVGYENAVHGSKPVNLFDPVQRAQAEMGVGEGTAADTGFKFSV